MNGNISSVNLKYKSFSDIKKVFLANLPLFAVILFLTLVTFINSVSGEFVSDDIPGIVQNPAAQDFGKALSSLNIQMIIHSILHGIGGLDPVPFHLFSMLMHVVNVILFFLIINGLFDKKVAAMASFFYTVHPLVSETVIWISAQNYLLNTFFLFISILGYLLYKENKKIRNLLPSFIILAIAPFSFGNNWVFIIPFFLVGIDIFLLNNKFGKNDLKLYISLFVATVGSFYLMNYRHVGERVATLATPEASPFLNRLPYSIYMTIELLVWPKALTLYHEGEIIPYAKYAFMIFMAVFIVVASLIMLRKEKYRVYAGLIALIYISILPVLSPIQVAWFAADRYLYVAVGLFSVILSILILKADAKWKNKNLLMIIPALILIGYTARTIVRTNDWKTQKSVWLSTVKVGPYGSRAHNNLGDAYGTERDFQKSILHFQYAIQINPNYYEAVHNLGNTYLQMGDYENARIYLLKSLEMYPYLYQATHKLGIVEYNTGNTEKAREYLLKTLELNPEYMPAINALQTMDALQASPQKTQ